MCVSSEMFRHINGDTEGTEFTIKCSFLEIYKEHVRDLFNPKKTNLKVHETPGRGVWVEDLTEEASVPWPVSRPRNKVIQTDAQHAHQLVCDNGK